MKNYIGIHGNRSESDNGAYIAAVKEALFDESKFVNFKRDPRYLQILEHVNYQQGFEYLKYVKRSSLFMSKIDLFRENDLVGNPTLYNYEDVGTISPSTLRYVKVALDLMLLFSHDVGLRIAEIGVGYGGQCLIFDKIFKYSKYDLFDLSPVLSLATKYLESFNLNGSYSCSTLNQCCGSEIYDLVISNYAFSELPSLLQINYIKKVISKAKKGYMIMNSGKEDCVFKADKLTIDELRNLLPPFEIMEESPLTAPGNYVIVWGRC